jgi:hypothetical protein
LRENRSRRRLVDEKELLNKNEIRSTKVNSKMSEAGISKELNKDSREEVEVFEDYLGLNNFCKNQKVSE